ncbi:MAG: hypothetical protein ACXQTJ_05725 [Candidatus Syntropharchaeales archaeon]
MGNLEEWIREKKPVLSPEDEKILEDLRVDAQFSLYCQIGTGDSTGGGSCMANFGKKVAKHAPRFKRDANELFQKLLEVAAEAAQRGDWDI